MISEQNLQQESRPALMSFGKRVVADGGHVTVADISSSRGRGKDTRYVTDDRDGVCALSTCDDMCPEEEREKRVNETDVHKFEQLHPQVILILKFNDCFCI